MATRMTGPPDVLQVLFEFGAKVDGVNEQGSTALFDAMQMNNFDAAHVLIRQGASRHVIGALRHVIFCATFDESVARPTLTFNVRFCALLCKKSVIC